MKLFTTKILLLLFTAMILFSCQKEEEEFIDETDEETITANSTLGVLLTRTSQNRGDLDDIIDGSDCVTVNLPITVFANGQKVVIENEDDIDLVEDIFDQSNNDEDTLEILFPITVTLADFTQVTVNSQEELNAVIAACEDDLEDTIECVAFVYPLTFFTYNSDQQQTGTVTINSDVELYEFLDELDDDEDFIALQFPVSVVVNGETMTVNNNQELLTLLSNVDCDDTSTTITDFEENLTTGSWFITYYFDDLDETSDFNGFEFTFAADNTAQAVNGSNTVNGSWNITSGSTPDLELDFGEEDPLDELEEDWDIIEITSEIIRLKDVSGGDGSTDFLTFEREPNEGNGSEDLNAFIENLTTDTWFVNLYEDDNENETCDYTGFEFTYNLNGSVVAVGATRTVNGSWSAQNDSSGIDFVLNFSIQNEDDPFEDLNDDWDVQNFDAITINTQDISGGDGSVDVLNWGRNPATGCTTGNLETFNTNLTTSSWFVNLYEDDGDDETCDYESYEFTFNADGTTTAVSNAETINGTWSSQNSGSSSGVDLILNYDFTGGDDPFEDLNDDWDVLNFDANIIRMEDVSGGNGGTDRLTFGRNPATNCNGTGGAQELTDIMENGPWLVASYIDSGSDETDDYAGYSISFNMDGTVEATNGGTTFSGVWSITGGSDLDFNMDFGPDDPFEEFNDDWDVLNYTTTRVELQDVSGGGGGTDTLIFEKQ